ELRWPGHGAARLRRRQIARYVRCCGSCTDREGRVRAGGGRPSGHQPHSRALVPDGISPGRKGRARLTARLSGTVLITTSSFGSPDRSPIRRLEQEGLTVRENPYGRRLTKDEIKRALTPDVVGLLAGLEPLDRD